MALDVDTSAEGDSNMFTLKLLRRWRRCERKSIVMLGGRCLETGKIAEGICSPPHTAARFVSRFGGKRGRQELAAFVVAVDFTDDVEKSLEEVRI
jgi:hypothetical protein